MNRAKAQILALARAGNPVRAWSLFRDQGLDAICDDPSLLTLKGRLQKDLADRENGEGRTQFYREASSSYFSAFEARQDSYPLINAATLALLAGDDERSKELARQVLDLLDENPDEGETPYWREATRAEAMLLLGRSDDAQRALAAGIDQLPRAWEDHAATIRQFERVLRALGHDSSWLDSHRPPCAIHFSGMIGLEPNDPQLKNEISAAVAELKPGFAFGALAAGADIMLAEAMVDAGASLHVILPADVDSFRDTSVTPFGSDWGARFDALLDFAEQIETASPAWQENEDMGRGAIALASLAAMGQCLRQAEVNATVGRAITIASTEEETRPHIAEWERAGLPIYKIATKRAHSFETTSPSMDASDIAPSSALLAVRGSDRAAINDCAPATGVEILATREGSLLTGDPGSCLKTAIECTRRDSKTAAGMAIAPASLCASDKTLGDMAERLLSVASEGTIFTDRFSAMVCKTLEPTISVEEQGELSSPTGPVPLWLVRSA